MAWGDIGGLLGGVGGHQGCQGCIGGGKWTRSLTTLGPSLGYQHSYWFPLGSDLPHQGQARAPFQGPITPTGFPWGVTYLAKAKEQKWALQAIIYTFGTIFCDNLHICIYATSSHILTCNVKKCYMDYFLCRPIYAYPYTINLTYYDTMVLIMKNYFFIRHLSCVHLTANVKLTWCSTAFCISHV